MKLCTGVLLLGSTLGTVGTSVLIPVLVATLTALITTMVTRASEATNRRRDRYSQAVETLVAWVEFPYRVRRRTDDQAATLTALAGIGHDLQERLACHEAWIATEHPALARTYARVRGTVGNAVAPAVADAWSSPPVEAATGMNLGSWGPASPCSSAIKELERQISTRFGLRRASAWLGRSGDRANSKRGRCH